MNVHVRVVDLDGDTADEVATVIERVLAGQSEDEVERAKRAVLETLSAHAIESPGAPVVTGPVETITTPGALAELGAAEAREELRDTLYNLQNEPVPSAPAVDDAPVPPTGYDRWDQVPTKRRVWSATGTLHISRELDGIDLYCPLVVGGLAKPHEWMPPAASLAKVCASCNKHIRKEARKDNA